MSLTSGATNISFRGGGGGLELWERAPRYYGPPWVIRPPGVWLLIEPEATL